METEEDYTNGQLNAIHEYFENGNLKLKGSCIKGLNHGEWTYWNIDGRLVFKGNFSRNKKIGEWVRFFPNGDRMQLYYENGELVSKKLGGIVKKN